MIYELWTRDYTKKDVISFQVLRNAPIGIATEWIRRCKQERARNGTLGRDYWLKPVE